MTGLRILFVTPYVPSSVRIRPLAFIRELARLGHQISLVCLVQPAREAAYLDEVRPYCSALYPIVPNRVEPILRTAASLPTRVPLSVAYCRSAAFERQVREMASQAEGASYDLIHTEFLRAAPTTLHLDGLPKIFDAVDSLVLTYRRSLSAAQVSPRQRLIALLEWLKLRRYEPWVLNHYDRVLASSPADSQALKQGSRQVEVIPNGVDAHYFAFEERQSDEQTLVFLGKMSYYVNVASVLWFARQVLPLIRQQYPGVKFKIVGRDPVPSIQSLANDPGIEVTGTVPDVRPYLSKATVSVCPLVSGAGIQNKMLEAMAAGAPCVATSLACHALQIQVGREVFIADSAKDFASAVCELLASPMLRRQLAGNSRCYVEHFHNWARIGECLADVYQGVL